MLVSQPVYSAYVSLPPADKIPYKIHSNFQFSGYFDDCLGAIDGSHLDAFVPAEDMNRYQSRKGRISTNLLAACTFDMRFCYILSGWEGSAADSRIFDAARQKDFAIPPGKYYLGDAGFPSCNSLLVPYCGVRYHLKEWNNAGLKFVVFVGICSPILKTSF